MKIIIKRTSKPDKKFEAILDGGRKTLPFGAKGMSDYTIHKDTDRKERYIARHKTTEDWNNYNTAGFYSRWILWNKPTITESIRDTNRRFPNVKISLGKYFFNIIYYGYYIF